MTATISILLGVTIFINLFLVYYLTISFQRIKALEERIDELDSYTGATYKQALANQKTLNALLDLQTAKNKADAKN